MNNTTNEPPVSLLNAHVLADVQDLLEHYQPHLEPTPTVEVVGLFQFPSYVPSDSHLFSFHDPYLLCFTLYCIVDTPEVSDMESRLKQLKETLPSIPAYFQVDAYDESLSQGNVYEAWQAYSTLLDYSESMRQTMMEAEQEVNRLQETTRGLMKQVSFLALP